MTTRTGSCQCGEIKIAISGDPLTAGECHCGQCQKISGGNAAALMVFPKDAVSITNGELRFYETVADSGNSIARGFCPNCGTPIMSHLGRTDAIVVVKLGAMDDRSFFMPDVIFWTDTAYDWVRFPEGTTQFKGNPPRR